ncbi:MAG: putative Coenzyme F420-dependent N(10)-methylenetetrahydromethanopterin reductase [Ilumatobacteraceae bacterium]|nr:putative Coenzyme F420-dependent N(10)-methylenetetrahydromethanopterin reductase [Ilumatobacteraceae bacterium]
MTIADELGCYVLPGGVSDPTVAFAEAAAAEDLGLGTIWIGERYDTKDLPSLAGALGATTRRVRIGAGVTHPGLRHPMVLASMGQTLQAITGGRFLLGLGRSAMWRWNAYGVAAPTLASLADTADILRRLWAGETVTYTGPAGDFPLLRLPQRPAIAPPPLLLAAVGPKTLALAGRCFDGAILHPFLTPEAVGRAATVIRNAAEAAGRDPAAVRCYAAVVTASDCSADETDLAVGARAAGYFHVPGLGDALAAANGWSSADLARYRADPVLVGLGDRTADKHLSRPELVRLSRTFPPGWLASSAATGSSSASAAKLRAYLAAGADELILHGSTAPQLGPLVDAFGAR